LEANKMVRIISLKDLYSNKFVEIISKEVVLNIVVVTYSIYGTLNQILFTDTGKVLEVRTNIQS
jgi:hypothetical protein